MKQYIKRLFLFGLLLSTILHAHAYDLYVDGIYYNANVETMELTVTNGENAYKGEIVIPSQVDYKGRIFTVKEIGTDAFKASEIEKVVIPSSVKLIWWNAFEECEQLTQLTLNEGLLQIFDRAFYKCKQLESLTIPSSVTSIGDYAFRETGIKKLVLVDGDKNISLSGIGSSPTEYVYLGRTIDNYDFSFYNMPIKNFVIGNKVKRLPAELLKDLQIEELTIPSSVTFVGRSCMSSNLKKLTIEDSDIALYWGIYSNMPNLKEIYYGRNLKIEKYNTEFSECNKLEKVIIGKYVTDFEDVCFNSTLNEVYANSTTPNIYEHSPFTSGTYLSATLFVPQGSLEDYKNAEGWKNFWEIKEISSGDNTPNKCEKPIIRYNNGVLSFDCATEAVSYQYTISDEDIRTGSGSELQLSITYNITVFATKAGYQNSETATATLCWIDVEPKTEGITDVIAQMSARAVMVKAEGGQLTVEGAEDNTNISVYTIDGVQVGTSTSRNGVALINTSIPKSSVAIVKIGNKSVKVMMK